MDVSHVNVRRGQGGSDFDAPPLSRNQENAILLENARAMVRAAEAKSRQAAEEMKVQAQPNLLQRAPKCRIEIEF
jgi:hypothetical protein